MYKRQDINPELPGADVLLKLIGQCDADPSISTARLLERFNGTSTHPFLVKLAIKPYWPDARELDLKTATEEFAHCILRLRERSKITLADKVDISAKQGLLGIVRR